MLIFFGFFLITGILINIKGFKTKLTIVSFLVFIIAFLLYLEFPLSDEIVAWQEEPVTSVNGEYKEIEVSFNADRIEFSHPATLIDKNGQAVNSAVPAGKYTVISNTREGDLTYSLYVSLKGYKLFLAILFAFLAAWTMIIVRFASTLSVEKLFLLFGIPLVIIYLSLFPIGAVPDARSHFQATYQFSNVLYGSPQWTARADDVWFFQNCWKYRFNTAVSYRVLASNFSISIQNSTMVPWESVEKMSFYSLVNYLPQLLGLIIARLVGLGTVPTLFLIRFLIGATYILIIYRAIFKIPSGKHILFLTALFPTSLAMATSVSYDAMLIIASFAFIASVLSESWIEIIIWSFLLGSIKGGGMLLLIPLIILLKDKWKIISAFVSGIVSLVLFDVVLPNIGLFQFGMAGNGNYTALYALQAPFNYLRMMFRTYIQSMDHLAAEIGGTYLSWGLYAVPFIIVIALFVLGWIMATHEKDQKEVMNRKWVWFIPIILSVILTPIMLLSWTPIGNDTINGLQGRYYFPMLIPILFLLGKQSLYAGENKTVLKKSYQWTGAVSAIAVLFIARMFFTAVPTF